MQNFRHFFFDEVFYSESLPSSNKKAETLVKSNSELGNFLVFSKTQTGSYGRKKTSWYAPEGGIWMTAAFYNLPLKSGLTIFTGICIHKAIEEYFSQNLFMDNVPDNLKIKWPNDLYWQDKKICGILTTYLENWKYHIVGIGLNTNNIDFPPDLQDISTALKTITGHEINNLILMEKIFDQISKELPVFIEDTIDIDYYNNYSYLINKTVILDTDFDKFKGEVIGINKFGALLLKMNSGMIQPFYSGTVVLA